MNELDNNAHFTLFSTYHKAFPLPGTSIVKPIQVGKTLSAINLGIQNDNTGENISALNPYFAELTAAYYIWKNYSAEKLPYWGLCHYRRYFIQHQNLLTPYKRLYNFTSAEEAFKKIFTPGFVDKINKDLQQDKIIMPALYRFIKLKKWSVKQQYIKDHDALSWNITEEIVASLYPEFVVSINEFANGLTCSWYNMLIAKWQFWDEYLTWLFNILFKVKHGLENSYSQVPFRIYAYLAERLLNVYVHHQKKKGLKISYLPIAHISL
jgi:hypothetical protein